MISADSFELRNARGKYFVCVMGMLMNKLGPELEEVSIAIFLLESQRTIESDHGICAIQSDLVTP